MTVVMATNEDDELALLSAALDEIYWLRGALAYEAHKTEAQLRRFRSIPLTTRRALENSVRRMRGAVQGSAATHYSPVKDRIDALRALDRDTLTATQWRQEVEARRRERQ